MNSKKYRIALVGNPNSGKTTLFNILTGSRQHVGNWSGVTVEKKEGYFEYRGVLYEVVDLPGVYGLSPNSLEERIARDFIINEKPDLIINIIDGTTLERSLYLTSQLIDSHSRIILAINMCDEVEAKGIEINIEKLKTLLKFSVVPIVAKKEKGIKELLAKIPEVIKESPEDRIHINYGEDIERAIKDIECQLECENIKEKIFKRWIALQLLSGEEDLLPQKSPSLIGKLKKSKDYLASIYKEEIWELINDRRLGFINGVIKECVRIKPSLSKKDITETIDNFVLNRFLSFPIFAVILWLTFQLTFSLGGILSYWVDAGISVLINFISISMRDSILKDLIVDGIIAGVGGVLVFLPQIMILFFIIAILEDSGYMARIAFIMDRIMHFLGLHGKSFISLFMGIGCNVPGIMAARTLESEDDRKITIIINPFISCSARLPVYVLITSMFFPKTGGNVIFFIYLIGIFVSIFTAKLLKTFFFKKQSVPFVMELPPYRMPTLKTLLIHMWERGSIFLKKMGGVILVGSILIWTLGYFPRQVRFPLQIQEFENLTKIEKDVTKKEEMMAQLEKMKNSFQLENSYIGKIGKVISPFFKPLGFSWREGVALLTGFVAKEVVVSTLSVLYASGEEEKDKLKNRMMENGFNQSSAFAFLLFVLLYMPCVATLAAIFRETNSLKWTAFSVFYGIFVAYAIAFLFSKANIFLSFLL